MKKDRVDVTNTLSGVSETFVVVYRPEDVFVRASPQQGFIDTGYLPHISSVAIWTHVDEFKSPYEHQKRKDLSASGVIISTNSQGLASLPFAYGNIRVMPVVASSEEINIILFDNFVAISAKPNTLYYITGFVNP